MSTNAGRRYVIAATAAVGSLAGTLPVQAVTPPPEYSVTLTAEPTTLETGEQSVLTTTANQDLTGTRYTTYLFDQTDPSWYRTCKVQTCSFPVTHSSPGTHSYIAYIARDRADPRYPPTQIKATSDPVSVTWSPSTFTVTLAADRTWLPPGSTTTLTATTNKDVGPRGYVIQIYDVGTSQRIAACAAGTTCSTFVTELSPTTRTFQAFVADSSATAPPPDIRASSNVVAVTWSVLPDPARPPNVGAGDVTGVVTFPSGGVPPLGASCATTAFVFDGSSRSAWVNGSGTAYVGPVTISATGGSVCETATTGAGALTVAASGSSPTGSLSCGELAGTFTRVLSHVVVNVNGDCVINGFPAVRVSFVATGEFVPTNEGGGTTAPVSEATFVGGFVVVPS